MSITIAENGKYLSRIFLVLQPFLLTACFYSMNGCNSGEVKKSVLPGLEADYLVLNEKILLNFFGSPDEKDWALKTLEVRCMEEEDPHACYNLASHLLSNKNYPGALKFGEKAIMLNPKDSLYLEMYRQAVIENGKIETVTQTVMRKTEPRFLFTKLETECKNKKSESVFATALELTSQNMLSQESIQNGFLKECLSEKMASDLIAKSQKNKINFSSYYFTEKNKSNIFYSIWDTSYLTKNLPLEKEEDLKYKLTQHWRDFRRAVASKNEKLARKTLGEFIKELNQEKTSSKRDANLFLAIERAAKLLIEQDDFFSKYKALADEF